MVDQGSEALVCRNSAVDQVADPDVLTVSLVELLVGY